MRVITKTGKNYMLRRISLPQGKVFSAAWSTDKPLSIAFGGSDGELGVWNLDTNADVVAHFGDRLPPLDEDLRHAKAQAATLKPPPAALEQSEESDDNGSEDEDGSEDE